MKRMLLCAMFMLVLLFSVACGGSTPAPVTQAPATPASAVVTTAAPAQPAAATATLVPTKAPSTADVTATNAPMPDSVLKLVNTNWKWVKSTDNSGKVTTVDHPDQYTLQFFLADGKVAVKADCNNAAGSFTADAHNLSITLGPTTLAACPPGSLSDQYLKELGEVQTYLFEGTDVIMGWKMDSGSMRFTPVGSSTTPTATVKAAATAKPKPQATIPPKPATTLTFNVDLVGCREAPTKEKPGGIVLLFRFEPKGAPGPYRYFDVDENKEVTELYERTASKGAAVIVTWAVQAADGQRLEKKLDYAASRFAEFGCK